MTRIGWVVTASAGLRFAPEDIMAPDCIVDACVNHGWADQREIVRYMSPGWREYLGRPGLLSNGAGMIPLSPATAYTYPASPGGEPARADRASATDPDLLRAALLDSGKINRAVLGFDDGAFATALINPYVATQIARAANDWTIERWLSTDPRLSSLMLVSMQSPDEAAAEIRRVGPNPRIVGVCLGGNGLGKSFGHPCYHTVYQAAAELDLPLVIKAGSEAVIDSPAAVSGVGDPATYGEYRVMESHALMTHATSMITQGVFETFRSLKVLLVGGGVLWAPALLWRLDDKYKGLNREVPWVRRLPSEYFRDHVRIGTYPFDRAPRPELLHKALSLFGGMDKILCFTGGFPNWDADEPGSVSRDLPPSAAASVMAGNAIGFYRGMKATEELRTAQHPAAVWNLAP